MTHTLTYADGFRARHSFLSWDRFISSRPSPILRHPSTPSFLQVVCFLQMNQPKLNMQFSSSAHVPHAQPIPSSVIWSPEHHLVGSTNRQVAHCCVFSSPHADFPKPNPSSLMPTCDKCRKQANAATECYSVTLWQQDSLQQEPVLLSAA
jgi:hypothetical protein